MQPITSRGYFGFRPLAKDSVVLQVNVGVPADFQDEHSRQLLANAIFWTAQRDPDRRK